MAGVYVGEGRHRYYSSTNVRPVAEVCVNYTQGRSDIYSLKTQALKFLSGCCSLALPPWVSANSLVDAS